MLARVTRGSHILMTFVLVMALSLIVSPVAGASGDPDRERSSPGVWEQPVAPQDGVLPSQAADKAVEMINEKLVSQGGRFHDLADARVDPDQMPMAAAIAASGDYRIDALLSPYQWGLPALTYSFYSTAASGGSYPCGQTVGEVSNGVKANVRQIMAWYSSLLNVDITEVQESSTSRGLIRVMTSSGPGYAYSYYPAGDAASCGGDVHLNPSYDRLGDTNGFQHPAGQHGYVALVHEIGHSLGLKHPFESGPVLPVAEENDSHTVMSYTWHGNAPGTPMAYDILALHHIYGSRAKNSGSEGYAFSTRGPDQYSLGGQQYLSTPYLTKQAIWDSAGANVLDFTALPANSSGYRLDLKGTGWLTAGTQYGGSYFGNGTALAAAVVISGVVNSGSSDTIYANSSANVFKGYSPDRNTGQDVIYDADSSDTVDLSGFTTSQVTQSRSGDDLVLGLGTRGSITLKGYYQGKQPGISFSSAPALPTLAVGDASLSEGNSGAFQAVLTVSLSLPAASPVTVNYATGNGTATAGSDYIAAAGTLTFIPGETVKSVSVSVIGDATVESDESFSFNLSNPSGASIADVQGQVTILNDDQVVINQAPVPNIAASSSSGIAPVAISFDGTASSDPDGTIVSYSWDFGDGTTGGGELASHTYSTAGSFVVVLTVTDNLGAKASASMAITVQQIPAKVVMVKSIDLTILAAARNGKVARAVVTIVDESGAGVPGAKMIGRWSGAVSGNSSGTTEAEGQATIDSKTFNKSGSVTFAVTSVSPPAGYSYAPEKNATSQASLLVTK